jgi:hypothetical protein
LLSNEIFKIMSGKPNLSKKNSVETCVN